MLNTDLWKKNQEFHLRMRAEEEAKAEAKRLRKIREEW
jgi:hypothetical protein